MWLLEELWVNGHQQEGTGLLCVYIYTEGRIPEIHIPPCAALAIQAWDRSCQVDPKGDHPLDSLVATAFGPFDEGDLSNLLKAGADGTVSRQPVVPRVCCSQSRRPVSQPTC